jgi:hypothetical protein
MGKEEKAPLVKNEKENGEKEPDNKEVVIPDEVLNQIPPKARGEIKSMLSMISAGYVGPPPNPIAKKLTGDHITKIIDYQEKDDQRGFDYAKDERKMSLIIFFGILIPVTCLIVFFALIDKVEILIPLISAIVAFGGGYGFGKSKK